MKQTLYTVCSNEPLARQVFRMRLLGDTSAITAPGQFVDLALPGFFLRRPISICDYDADGLTIIYKVVGKGTAALSRLAPGAELDALSGLGNGFDTQKSGESPLLIGGGVDAQNAGQLKGRAQGFIIGSCLKTPGGPYADLSPRACREVAEAFAKQ